MENTRHRALTAYFNAETDQHIASMALTEIGPYVGTSTGKARLFDLITVPDRDGVFIECTPERVNISVEGLHDASVSAIVQLVRELQTLGLPIWLTDMDVPEGLFVTATQTDDAVRSWITRLRSTR